MKVLVIGGAGYIGSNMVLKLLENKHSPAVFDNLCTGHRRLVSKKAPFMKGDLRDFKDILAALKEHKPDAVMHFAASALVGESVEDPLKYYDNNVAACIQLLKAMKEMNVNKFIFSSTCAIFGEPKQVPIREDDPKSPMNPYGQSKLTIEHMLRDLARSSDLRYVALRYFNACGAHPSGETGELHDPEAHLIPNILKVLTGEKKELQIFGDDYDTPDGTCVRDYVHIEDLATAHLLAMEMLAKGKKSDVFNLGSGNGHSVKEIVQTVERVTGQKVKIKICPRRPGDPAKLVAGAEKARKILGWKPEHDLESIIRTAWRWEKSKAKKEAMG